MKKMTNAPLAEKLRPQKIAGYVGQEHLVGKNGVISKLLNNSKASNFFPSLIFWGPPGSGKTTLAGIIAKELKREYYEYSAVSSSIKDIEKLIKSTMQVTDSKSLLTLGGLAFKGSAPIVVIDEIHRFNKAQQAKLLPYVEKGNIILIGATTENPSFEVIAPLLSRCRVVTLNQLTERELETILKNALKELKVKIDNKAKEYLIEASNGDARVMLNVLEIASNLTDHRILTTEHLSQALQREQYTFDKKGEDYYNVISAFIKSMRASNPDAALYYLARMVAAGQDPLYIARRMVVFASEDIGMAQPTALVVANGVFRACETIGYPECQENLAAGVVYLACAKKDRSAYNAYMSALEDVRRFGNLPVPMPIRNAPTKLMKELGYGKGYDKYTKESLLPDKLKGKVYYNRS